MNNAVTEENLLNKLIGFEEGTLGSYDELVALFQYLIDTGLAWKLQGLYGRIARDLIESGHCQIA